MSLIKIISKDGQEKIVDIDKIKTGKISIQTKPGDRIEIVGVNKNSVNAIKDGTTLVLQLPNNQEVRLEKLYEAVTTQVEEKVANAEQTTAGAIIEQLNEEKPTASVEKVQEQSVQLDFVSQEGLVESIVLENLESVENFVENEVETLLEENPDVQPEAQQPQKPEAQQLEVQQPQQDNYIPEYVPEDTVDIPEDTVEVTPEDTLEDTPEDTVEDTPEDTVEDTPEDTVEDTPVEEPEPKDTTPPTVLSSNFEVNSKTLTIELNEEGIKGFDSANLKDSFSVTINGTPVSIESVTKGSIVVTLSNSIPNNANVVLSYDGIGGLTDASNNALAAFSLSTDTNDFNIAPDTTAPTTTISNIDISADTGSSANDFLTKTASQTITATLSQALESGEESLWGSTDGGTTWTDITDKVTGTDIFWDSTTLLGSNEIQFQVRDSAPVVNTGPTASQSYTLDTTAPVFPDGA
ncbi:SwmB domain-containing protein, partial [Poseidonibacter ostreae]